MRTLRTGFTTGACAAAAAKAAVAVLIGQAAGEEIEIGLPDGARVALPLLWAQRNGDSAAAAVGKDAGDDPDVTHGASVVASVAWAEGGDVTFVAGEGVGVVTKPGLSLPPGQPAINPVPRRMIREAVRELTPRGVTVTIAVPGGEKLAQKTANPRLGIVGGVSILGTTGIVRPFSCPALREALKCGLSVASAAGLDALVLVPGHIGERAARAHFRLAAEQVIEVGNEWGYMLDAAFAYPFQRLLAMGHPGKLAKLVAGDWDTHSARSRSALETVAAMAERLLGQRESESPTVEGFFQALPEAERRQLGDVLAGEVRDAISARIAGRFDVAVALVDMQNAMLGCSGDLSPWQ